MFSFRTSKILYLVPAAILALSDAAPANTCTDAWFDIFNSTYFTAVRDVYLDSTFSKDDRDEVTTKYLYENGKPVQTHTVTTYTNNTLDSYNYIYYDVDESALKNIENEHINSIYKTSDTTFYQTKSYHEGEYLGTRTIKATSNYIQAESNNDVVEIFLFQDSIAENMYIYYGTDSARTIQAFIVADPDDDFKCNQKNDAGETETVIFYKPNESGFSLSYQLKTRFNEYFFIESQKTTSIRKTLKPVNISPKARYFDLLGRYKFTK